MKKPKFTTVLLVLVFFIGLSVMLYPTVSDWWNSRVQTKAIVNYEEVVADMTEADYTAEFEKAEAYNKALREISSPLVNYEDVEGYEGALNVAGNGIIGYISIPRIDETLPIYHGTSDSVLDMAAGHLEGTSLPIGGEGTHAVISAHRGLPSAKLFSDLDKMEEGDTFTISVLDRLLTYEVDQIRIVEPEDVSDLSIVEGEDYVTLLTCTPYGINTHRLLVRGHRIENADSTTINVVTDAYELDPMIIAPVFAVPILIVLFIVLMMGGRKKRRKKNRGRKKEPGGRSGSEDAPDIREPEKDQEEKR